jgi:hypothetical protein
VTMQVTAFEERCVAIIVKMVGLGTILASAELLSLRKDWGDKGLFSWAVTRTCYNAPMRNGSIVLLDAICDERRYVHLLCLEMLCGVVLLFDLLPNHKPYILLGILFVHFITFLRALGTDGADQMQTILLICLACYYATPDPMVKKAALWFVALQAILAYFTAGVAKFWCKVWLNGTVLRDSFALAVGSEAIYKWLPNNARARQIMCWSVIAFECSFPLVMVLTPGICMVYLGAGLMLHLTNAFALGLPRFLFTFVAAYPAIVFFTGDIQSALRGVLWTSLMRGG